jgi:ubiquitin thioesterase protein OTUB1
MEPPPSGAIPTAEQQQQQQARLAEIRAEVAATQALVGEAQPSETLLAHYATNPGFLAQLPPLIASYSHVRKVRGDGICFYRSLLVALGLAVHRAGALPADLLPRVRGAAAALISFGYSEFVDDFVEALAGYLEGLVAPGRGDAEAAAVAPLQEGVGDSILYGLRLLTALQLHETAAECAVFIEAVHMMTIEQFCNQTVLPNTEEADHIQINALATWLRVSLTIVSVDAHTLSSSVVPEAATLEGLGGAVHRLALLLRPGHYDVLTPR